MKTLMRETNSKINIAEINTAATPQTPSADYVVRVPFGGGVGVLVGDVILTAAHCVNYVAAGPMARDDSHVEEIVTFQGCRLKAALLAVELVYDIAVLGSLDMQEWPEEAAAFQRYCEMTKPVPLARSLIQNGERLTVSIRNRDGYWVEGSTLVGRNDLPGFHFETEKEVEKGASGGPVLNRHGELVGLVSVLQQEQRHRIQSLWCPQPLRTLPVWVCEDFLSEVVDEYCGSVEAT